MPELPEVETIKNELLPCIVGRSVTGVDILDVNLVSGIPIEEVRHRLIGQTIDNLERRGKYLIFRLADGHALIMHFRMTGILLLNPQRIDHHARAVFHFSDGNRLVFRDPRRFGVLWMGKDSNSILGKLGPEPLSEDFTPRVLAQKLSKHHIPVKAALLDQSLIAGIGNMYADESLFSSHIHPLRAADTLSPEEIWNLHCSIQEILLQAIDNKGASVDTYVRPGGQAGTAQFSFRVAHRGGKACPICGSPIEKILVRSRGTCFCPECQPAGLGPLI